MNTTIQTCYTFKIKTAYADYVFAVCVTSPVAIVKLYYLHWTLTGMYSLNTR